MLPPPPPIDVPRSSRDRVHINHWSRSRLGQIREFARANEVIEMRRRDFSIGLLLVDAVMHPLLAQEPAKQRRIAIVAATGRARETSARPDQAFGARFSRSWAAWVMSRGVI